MKFGFTGRLRVTGNLARLEGELDKIMEELCRLGVTDPWIGATMSTGEVDVSLEVAAVNLEKAFAAAMSTVRSAIQAAGGSTPDWPHVEVERVELEEAGIPASASA